MAAKKDFYVYWDSCVFLSYLNGIPGRVDVIEDMWKGIVNEKNGAIITSSLSIAEVAHLDIEKKHQKLYQDSEDRISGLWLDPNILIVEASRFIMESARSIMREAITEGWALKAYDSIHLATAKFMETNGFLIQEFNTYDQGFDKYKTLVGIAICEPHYEPPPPPPPEQTQLF